jgi:AraC-like DNA-binding protein/mannose-6-phosphate isomerase-like protein (cupin superfamily)
MPANYEDINSPQSGSFNVKLIDAEQFPFYWHYNSCYELTLIVHGSGNRYIGDNISEVSAGELVLLGPNLPHSWCSPEESGRCEAVVVHFREDFAGESIFSLTEMQTIKNMLKRACRGLVFDKELSQTLAGDIAELSEIHGWKKITSLLNILGRLSESPNANTISAGEHFSSLERTSQDRFSKVCRYINANFTDPQLSRISSAAQIHMSSSRFSRFFKEVCGKSYIEYVNELRINHACKMLIETDRSVTDICFDAGFNNIANFNRRFLRLKTKTPREYRQAFNKN